MVQEKREIVIAAVQMESIQGDIKGNHARAERLIEQAARGGAKLIVLPELFSCGYIPNSDTWKYGEVDNSNTVKWLQETSERLGVYLGAGILEIIGDDYINTFVLTNPNGDIEGRIQKYNAEAYCFKRVKGEYIINSSLAKIAVGICADNHYVDFIRKIRESDVDLLLMPHAWSTPYKASKVVSVDDVNRIREEIKGFASLVTSLTGIPSVFINQIGQALLMSGILGKMMDPEIYRMQGYSRIVDSDGAVKSELDDKEGIAVAKITIGHSSKKIRDISNYYGWIHPGSGLVRKLIIPVDIFIGSLYYKFNKKRKMELEKIRNS